MSTSIFLHTKGKIESEVALIVQNATQVCGWGNVQVFGCTIVYVYSLQHAAIMKMKAAYEAS